MSKLIQILKRSQLPQKEEKFLGEGYFSVTYLTHKDGRQVVIKYPRKGMSKERWQDEMDFAYEGLKSIENLNVPVFIPKILKKRSNYVIEEYASGEQLTSELYTSLTPEEQNKIARDIAVFLNEMHQSHLLIEENVKPRTAFSDWRFDKNLEKITGSRMASLYQNVMSVYKLDFIGRTQSITHCDLRSENILYDKNAQKVSVIDFGQMVCGHDVYADFSPSIYKPLGLPWNLTKKIVEHYNKLEKKTPIFIDINLVRDMQLAKLFKIFSIQDEIYNIYRDSDQVSVKALQAASKIFKKQFKPLIEERLADRPHDGYTTPEMRYRPYSFKGRLPSSKNSRSD